LNRIKGWIFDVYALSAGISQGRAWSRCSPETDTPGLPKRSTAHVSHPHPWCARLQCHAWRQHAPRNRTGRTELGDNHRAVSNQGAVTTQLLVLLPCLRNAGHDRLLIATTFRQALAHVCREKHLGEILVRNTTAPLGGGCFCATERLIIS
jgi:hypothetical protein